jgi:uncharacterized protein YyaL (SSP411 family)
LKLVIRLLLQYADHFSRGLLDPQVRALIISHARSLPVSKAIDPDQCLNAVADHFCLAQDSSKDGGLGSFHLIHGWSASYPETTGYIIPTLLQLADRLSRPELQERAVRAGEWLLRIQRGDGGWQGGRIDENRPSIVFNTAQVVRGMLALYASLGEDRYLDAAISAGDWIVKVQEPQGAWVKHNFMHQERVYDSYVSAPLLHLSKITSKEAYRSAAMKNFDRVLQHQRPNGWFNNADNTIKHNDRPITHTIAYTIDGLLEGHLISGEQQILQAARKAADVLLAHFLKNGSLHGRYDKEWRGSEDAITTGNAQLAICWGRLGRITGDPQYAQGVDRMAEWLKAVQRLSASGPVEGHGAVTGSFPLWGRYEKFAFPNWAQKYMADALLCAEGILPQY